MIYPARIRNESHPRVALTTDWLTSFGGAERVLAELLTVFPGAPIHTTVHDPRGLPEHCRDWNVVTSFLQRVPLARRHYRAFLPLMPLAFETFDVSGYDVVLTTSSAFAKGVLAPPDVPNVCYCHTPPRYLWDQFHEQTRDVRARGAVRAAASVLRLWDRVAADRVDTFIANSATTAARIQRYYRRDSTIVHPPVDCDTFQPNGRGPEDFLLVVARLVPYKRVDLAVAAAARLNMPLVVVGVGPELRRLQASAGPSVRFLGSRSDREVADLYSRCRAFIFPGMEDFGIAAVEAQAAGRPVVAYGRGGAVETVVDGQTGVLVDTQTVEAIADGIDRVVRAELDPDVCRENALRFDASVFRDRMADIVAEAVRTARSTLRPSAVEPDDRPLVLH